MSEEELIKLPYFEDLLNVGKTKMVGYLPIRTMIHYGAKESIGLVQHFAEQNHLDCMIVSELISNCASGALYIWHPIQLEIFLNNHIQTFTDAGIPTKPDKYVFYIATITVPKDLYPEAYKLIGKTFNDPRFRDE